MIIYGLAFLAFATQTPPDPPCPEVGFPQDYWSSIRNNVTFGNFSLQTQEGVTDCRFTNVENGQCFVYGPARFRVKASGKDTYFAVPDQLGADIRISEGTYTCRVSRVVRTD